MIKGFQRQQDVSMLFGLVVAGLLVAVAIVADGAVAKTFNGIGGIIWIASAVRLLLALRNDPQFLRNLAVTVATGLVLVLLAKPDDFVAAVIGFGLGGALVSLASGERGTRWALLLAALWLPLHLFVAVARVLERAMSDLPATIRRDPPPTAALVPLSMILAAWLGAMVVQMIRGRRSQKTRSWVDQVS